MTLLHAVSISTLILALFYYWFGIADRYAIFLYNHPIHGPSGPFDEVTVGRYWMSGLVASGIVMALYVAANLGLARIWRDYRVPAWWRVWLQCALPLAIGIPLITMNVNSPTMPLTIALAIVLATLAGLALALMPGALAAHRPRELVWIALDGLGLVPPLLLMRAIELPARGLSISLLTAYAFEIGGIVVGVFWLAAMSIARARFRLAALSPLATSGLACGASVFLAGLCWSYLFLPLAHHVIATPAPYRYITTSGNFFAFDLGLQVFTWLVAAGLAIGAARISHGKLFAFAA